MTTEGPLKQLGFLKTAAESSVSYVTSLTAFNKACGLYSGLHETKMLKPTFESLESRIAPLVEKAPETATKLLTDIDSRLDTGVVALSDLIQKAKTSTSEGYDSIKTIANKKIEAVSNVPYIQANLALVKSVDKALVSLREKGVQLPADLYATLNKHLQATNVYMEGCIEGSKKFSVETAEYMRKNIMATWEKIASHPTVKGALDKVQPALISAKNATITKLLVLKDSKLSQAYVVPAVEKIGTYAVKVQGTERYQTYVSPYVAKAMSTEAYGLMQKQVVALVESLKAEEEFYESSESGASEDVGEVDATPSDTASVDSHSVDN